MPDIGLGLYLARVLAKRILVVDDEAKLLRAVAVTLRGDGYEVTTASHKRYKPSTGHH